MFGTLIQRREVAYKVHWSLIHAASRGSACEFDDGPLTFRSDAVAAILLRSFSEPDER